MQNTAINPLKDHLLHLTDPRLKRRRKHELIDVLMIAVTALLCGAENFTHMAHFRKAKEAWLRTFLTLAHGIPSHDTFRRAFMLLAPEKFSEVFLNWTPFLRQAVGLWSLGRVSGGVCNAFHPLRAFNCRPGRL